MLMKQLFFRSAAVFTTLLNLILSPELTSANPWIIPSHEFNTVGPNAMSLASDANGHAIALLPDSNGFGSINASYFSDGIWGPEIPLSSLGPAQHTSLSMDDSGTALAIWSNPYRVETAFFDGTEWLLTSPPVLDNFPSYGVSVSMNGPNHGIAIWINTSTSDVRYSIFSNGIWTSPATVQAGTGNSNPVVAYSTNGTAVAGWHSTADTTVVANFDGTSWTTTTLDSTSINFFQTVGIDSNGNAIALWKNATDDVVVSNYSGGSWQSPLTFDTAIGTNNFDLDLAMSRNGTAVVIWKDATTNGLSRSYDGSNWASAITFATNAVQAANDGRNMAVAVDNNGNALVIWESSVPQILSSSLPLGGTVWSPLQVVDPDPIVHGSLPVTRVLSSLSENGTGFAGWNQAGVGTFFFANAMVQTSPPGSIEGNTVRQVYPTFTDRVHVICWTASPDTNIAVYLLRRNGVLIATIPFTGRFSYCDHNRCKCPPDVYTVTAVSINGIESEPLTVILQ